MPWHLEQRDGKYCVIKDADGHNQGCHPTRVEAIKQMRALYAQEGTMTAAAETIHATPPVDWFTLDEADEPTPLTFTEQGQVYGHLALWGTCHTGFLTSAFSECVTPPRSESGYQYFNLGDPTGKGVGAGNITYGTGHAPLSLGMQAAAAHYDNTGTVGANVRASDGKLGIWLAGAVVPGADMRLLRSTAPSGDWRPIRRGLELTAALAVPVPGFPVPRSQLALSASGISAMILPGLTEDEIPQTRSRGYLRRREALSAAVLSTKGRDALPDSAFALPGRRYPIHDRAHAANALARVAQSGTPTEQRTVRAKVCRRYPDMPACKT